MTVPLGETISAEIMISKNSLSNSTEDKLGIYIHIPFCLQRCTYCDFATYSKDQIQANQNYVDTLLLEAENRRNLFSQKKIQTIYFGGGTPSLLEPAQIEQIISCFRKLDFTFEEDIEITLEVNPATLNPQKCLGLRQAGVNRLSVGCQSFNDEFLKACHREHNSEDSLNTLSLIQKHFDNYSLDLLFSLPEQNLAHLAADLKIIAQISPPHVSAYCLTVPAKHPMNKGRASEEVQVEMFNLVHSELLGAGLLQYEISNYSKPGLESRHNNLYWTDQSYWGLGLSAHSYQRNPSWGCRFWNPSTYEKYMEQVAQLKPCSLEESFPSSQIERLSFHESLTDFCHTHLRLMTGLNKTSLRQKFGDYAFLLVENRLSSLVKKNLLKKTQGTWTLTPEGILLSNLVFSELLLTQSDIDKLERGPII